MAEIIVTLLVTLLCFKPLGKYMARVMNGEQVKLARAFGWLERGMYRAAHINPQAEMDWRGYALQLIVFSTGGFLLLYILLLLQGLLPLNPQSFAGLSPDTAFNVAASFVTNTNWQSYSGEAALSYFSQMVGLAVQHFLSAAVGIAAACALFRALGRRETKTIGNAYADLTRATLYILLPLSLVFACALAAQGVVQSLSPYVTATGLENGTQLIPQGPAASQVAIKMLGSNGGGFFNANAAHPFENPTPLTNVLQLISMLLIPAALIYTFGVMAGDRRQAWALLAAVLLLFAPLSALCIWQEHQPNPAFKELGLDQSAGNMEGKETRLGVDASAFWAAATTATANGSSNAAHDSFMPLAGLAPLLLMQMGEVVFGGVGSGAYGLLMFVLVAVFLGGLMVGRTPEYLGKKIGPFEMKMASLAIILPCALTLIGTAVCVLSSAGQAGITNPGAQGFSEILYANTSAAANNGSAFAGLNAATPFYNTVLGVVMILGRFLVMIPALAVAGALAAKKHVPHCAGTLPTHTPLFVTLLAGVVLLLGVLSYAPALALGPVAEHLRLYSGH